MSPEILAQSMTEPPPSATRKSHPSAFMRSATIMTVATVGLGSTTPMCTTGMPRASSMSVTRPSAPMRSIERPFEVRSKALVPGRGSERRASSRPGPKTSLTGAKSTNCMNFSPKSVSPSGREGAEGDVPDVIAQKHFSAGGGRACAERAQGRRREERREGTTVPKNAWARSEK